MANKVRQALERGELVMGMMHFTGSPMLVEVMARAGLDFFIIDMEHSPIDLGLAAHLVRAADAAGITPFLRVPDVDPGLIKKVLNLGVQGIVIPHATRETCQAAVKAVRFAPEGTRGSCPAIRAAHYGPPDWKAYTSQANRDVLVIPLLEETETLEDIEALVALPGVDVVFLGPFDFAISCGAPGAGFDHPLIAEALDRVVAHARRHGKYVMTSVGDQISTDYGRQILARGVRLISFSADALVFLKACRDIAALKDFKTLARS
jgi:2-keto-3-deoxy-L-rhamnonate aldolase RhmA